MKGFSLKIKQEKLTRKEKEVISKIYTTISMKDINFNARVYNISNKLLLVLNENLNYDEKLWIFHYILVYFSKNIKDIIISFKLNSKNNEYHKRVFNLLKNRKFNSKKIKKLVGELNEKC